jgi:hypothetical protein
MRTHLLELLETRLRLVQVWSGRSEALAASLIQRPIFITGMPRSGSTFLHELLAEDPENRAPRVWEVMFPLPAQKPVRSEINLRVWKAEASLWWFRRLAPRADSFYPMRAWTPHECVAIHSHTFLSGEFDLLPACLRGVFERSRLWPYLQLAETLPATFAVRLSNQQMGFEISRPHIR